MAQQKLIEIWKGLLLYSAIVGLKEAKYSMLSFKVPQHPI